MYGEALRMPALGGRGIRSWRCARLWSPNAEHARISMGCRRMCPTDSMAGVARKCVTTRSIRRSFCLLPDLRGDRCVRHADYTQVSPFTHNRSVQLKVMRERTQRLTNQRQTLAGMELKTARARGLIGADRNLSNSASTPLAPVRAIGPTAQRVHYAGLMPSIAAQEPPKSFSRPAESFHLRRSTPSRGQHQRPQRAQWGGCEGSPHNRLIDKGRSPCLW